MSDSYQVVIPPGVAAGQTFQIQACGTVMSVTCPSDKKAGETITVMGPQVVPATVVASRSLLDPASGGLVSVAEKIHTPSHWTTGICGCCAMQDCGPLCCLNWFCCTPCIFGAIMARSQIDPLNTGLDEQARCFATCCGLICHVVPCQDCLIGGLARMEIAKKYAIQEEDTTTILLTICCLKCSLMQIANEIMVREDFKYGCCSVN